MAWISTLILLFTLPACSGYQSEGRKFLETQAFEFAGVSVQEAQVTCQPSPNAQNWILLEDTSANAFALEGETYQLRIQTKSDESFNCCFQFHSAQEMYKKLNAAVELTLQKFNSAPPKASACSK